MTFLFLSLPNPPLVPGGSACVGTALTSMMLPMNSPNFAPEPRRLRA